MNEVIYELKESFQYANKGDMSEASFISITAPNFKQLDKFTPIKQAFTAAIAELTESIDSEEAAKAAKDAEKDDINAAGVLQLMYRWSGEMTKVFLHAEQLFKSGAARVDGEVNLTSDLMQKMSMTDFENLVGTYIANFIAPSLMDGA